MSTTVKDLSAIQNAVTTSKPTTKNAFLVVIYDQCAAGKAKQRTLFATRVDHSSTVADVQGYDITTKCDQVVAQLKQTNKYDDAAEIAKSASEGLEFIQFPWHVVNCIKKLTFNIK